MSKIENKAFAHEKDRVSVFKKGISRRIMPNLAGRRIVVLAYWLESEGVGVRQAAKLLKISVSTAYRLLREARRSLDI